MTDLESMTLSEIAAERKRVNKLYKEKVAEERARRKPLEDAIQAMLPVIPYRMTGAQYREKCAEALAAMHDAGKLTIEGLGA